jgi:hypothetical protein
MLRTGCSFVRLRCSLTHRLVSPSWRRCCASHVVVPPRAAPITAARSSLPGHSLRHASLHGGWRCYATKELDTEAPGGHVRHRSHACTLHIAPVTARMPAHCNCTAWPWHRPWPAHSCALRANAVASMQPPGVRSEPILLAGFSTEQVLQFQEHLDEEGETSVQLVALPQAAMSLPLAEVLQAWKTPAAGASSSECCPPGWDDTASHAVDCGWDGL